MKKRLGTRIAALLSLLAVPALLAAQEHPAKHSRYILKDLGTFGGPNSFLGFTPRPLNNEGTVVGTADTPIHDPFDPYCFLDCFVAHAFQWRHGVLTDLGALTEGASSNPNGINAAGVVAGISENGAIDPQSAFPPEFDAVVWKNGQTIDLGTFGGTFSSANAINERSEVVGFALNGIPDSFFLEECGTDPISPTQMRAFLWQEGGGLRDLGTLGGTDSCATLINDRGLVAGHSFTNSTPNPVTGIPTDDPFVWENGVMTDLGSLGGTLGHPSGINRRGQVCGDSNLAGDLVPEAFLWDAGKMQDLGNLGGNGSLAKGLNESGEVIGVSNTEGDLTFHAFLWKHGVMTDLGTVVGDCHSFANGINSRGQVVGESDACDGSAHAFLWEKRGPPVDLNTLVPRDAAVTLVEATSIGDGGEIAVRGLLDNGDEHAFLLIPREGPGHDDDVAVATAATETDADPIALHSTTLDGLTPEVRAALRARLILRHRGLASRLGSPTRLSQAGSSTGREIEAK
jgi:probable HAF family extracellular repeat protein